MCVDISEQSIKGGGGGAANSEQSIKEGLPLEAADIAAFRY